MKSNDLDYLIPDISRKLISEFIKNLHDSGVYKNGEVDTAPFLNMTIGVFMSSLFNVLESIKKSTIGEIKLIQNIELTEKAIIKLFEDLPFIRGVIITD